jgi:hypothetical protein
MTEELLEQKNRIIRALEELCNRKVEIITINYSLSII